MNTKVSTLNSCRFKHRVFKNVNLSLEKSGKGVCVRWGLRSDASNPGAHGPGDRQKQASRHISRETGGVAVSDSLPDTPSASSFKIATHQTKSDLPPDTHTHNTAFLPDEPCLEMFGEFQLYFSFLICPIDLQKRNILRIKSKLEGGILIDKYVEGDW